MQRTGDYATTRFHHLRDATTQKVSLGKLPPLSIGARSFEAWLAQEGYEPAPLT